MAKHSRRKPTTRKASEPVRDVARRGWVLRHRWGLVAAILSCACACGVWAVSQQRQATAYGVQVVERFPHDARAYTQGLIFHDGFLYEGTGKRGESSLRKVELETGRVVQSLKLDHRLFGEGITLWNDRIIQLTWQNELGIVYDRETFKEVERFRYEGQGWGVTHDGTHLIVSDGSSTLRFLDPRTYRVVRRLRVHNNGRRVSNLNELEYVGDEIFANIWYKDYIVRISPQSGAVTGWIDLRGLLPNRRDRDHVLNGIAYDSAKKRLFVTGKNWPTLFEIRLVAR